MNYHAYNPPNPLLFREPSIPRCDNTRWTDEEQGMLYYRDSPLAGLLRPLRGLS